LLFLLDVATPFAQCCYYSWLNAIILLFDVLVILAQQNVPLVWHHCSLLDATTIPCSTPLLILLNVTTPFAQCHCSSCSLLLFLCSFILDATCSNSSLLHSWCCCSLLDIATLVALVSNWYPPPPPFNFLQVWEELSKFKFVELDLEDEIFFSIFVCWWIFWIIHVFGKCWLIMCLFIVCRNYLDIVHLIIHIAFHFYTLHCIFIIALCNFLAHCIFFLFFFRSLVNV
jgi:hypothetical protein